MKKILFIIIAVLILCGCQSHEDCKECNTQNWISSANKSVQKMISQITPVLLEQDYNDSLSFSFKDVRQNKFLIAKDTIRKNYQGNTLKWFKEYPDSWISIDSNSVTASIKYCEKWCENMPYVSQLFLVQTKSKPELLWDEALADIETFVHVKEDWYLVKTQCKGCGL
jgi:hypothetical protein